VWRAGLAGYNILLDLERQRTKISIAASSESRSTRSVMPLTDSSFSGITLPGTTQGM
jgi:hypothetical protein